MKNVVFCLVFLLLFINGFSQDISVTKKYDFGKALEQSRINNHTFTLISFELNKDQPVISYTSQVVFPLIEEKRILLFEVTEKKQYGPIISLDNLYQSRPKFINFAPHLQQNQPGKMKILKGYDYCLRPIY